MSADGTALVTGSCGFLGSHIAARLRSAGWKVAGVDASATESVTPSDEYRIALPSDSLGEVLRHEQPSLLVHAAGPASVGKSLEDPVSDFEGSVRVTAHLLDSVRRFAPEARVVLLSSAAVYGNPLALPIAEDAALAPVSPYGFHKAMCEELLREYSNVYGIRTAALRIFSAYGPGLRRQLLWDVCEKASRGVEVSLAGTGDETRDFVHADDIAQAVLVVAQKAPFAGEVYNVGSGTETTVRHLAVLLVEQLAPGTPIVFSGEVRDGDPLHWRADISRIRARGFAPSHSLEDGIAEYAQWYLSEGRS